MDHDAMWTHVQKLMKFRDDFLVLSKVTAEEFHEMADRARAGGNPQDLLDEKREAQRAAAEPAEPVKELEPAKTDLVPAGDDGKPIAGAEKPTGEVSDKTGIDGPVLDENGQEIVSGNDKKPAKEPEVVV